MSKYYTPDIEDLFVGYECEMQWSCGYDPTWTPYTIRVTDEEGAYGEIGFTFDMLDDGASAVRTKYLSQEDIEGLGWEYDEDSIRQLPLLRFVKYESGRVCNALWLDEDEHTIDIIENNFNGGGGYFTIFKGECKSINELRKIMKMIGIK